MIQHGFQRAGHLILAEVDVDDDREAQGDGACARGDDDLSIAPNVLTNAGTRSFVYFSRPGRSPGWTLPKIRAARMATVTAWMTAVTSWPSGTTRSSRPIFTPPSGGLVNAVADQEGQDALGLVVLDDRATSAAYVGLAEHDGHAGDVARDERDTQRADDGIGHKADAGIVA